MAITDVIDTTVPDGSTQNVAVLDNSIKDHKRQIKERMEDSIIDTGVTGWTTIVTKELIQGIARVHLDTLANIPVTRLQSGKIFIRTDPPDPDDATDVFEHYTGSAWNPIKIGSTNIINQSILTAAIKDANVTKGKIAANATFLRQTQVTDSTVITETGATWAAAGSLTFTVTPNSTNSLYLFILQCGIRSVGGTGAIRIRKTTATASTLALAQTINSTESLTPQWTTLIGFMTGETAAQTVRVEIVRAGGTTSMNIDGDNTFDSETLSTTFDAIELISA